MDDLETVHSQQEKDESLDVSTKEERVQSPVEVATESVKVCAGATILAEKTDTSHITEPPAKETINIDTTGNVVASLSEENDSQIDDQIALKNKPPVCVSPSTESHLSTDPDKEKQNGQEDKTQEGCVKEKADSEPMGEIMIKATEDIKEVSPDDSGCKEIIDSFSSEDYLPEEGSLIIAEDQEKSISDDVQLELNEQTGRFEIPQPNAQTGRFEILQPNAQTGRFEIPQFDVFSVIDEIKDGSEPDTGKTSEDAIAAKSDNDKNITDTVSVVLNEKKAISEEKPVLKKPQSSIDSIENSIERCIAHYSCDSSSENVDSPLKNVAKFAHDVGFKVITNKINIPPMKRASSSTESKPEDKTSGPSPAKKGKPKSKKSAEKNLRNSDGLQEQTTSGIKKNVQNAKKVTDPPTNEPKISKPCVINTTDDSSKGKSTVKERPFSLKVRDVESINAAIQIKAPVTVAPEAIPENGLGVTSDSRVLNEKVNNQMTHDTSSDIMVEMELETSQALQVNGAAGSGVHLRAIAPKCDPIANNDTQAVKMIKDLIQLPTVPVYVPQVSDSKYFNGRLHLCHGCGDRFVLLKSLLEHQNRRSCLIKFQCLKCESSVLCFFNRCEFVRHLYNHNQTLTNTMLQFHITVEKLPAQTSNVVFDVKICQECKLFLNVPLKEHMIASEQMDRKMDLALKCQWCSLMLPTKCAYQAHRRMHFLQSPHVCPECGDLSSDPHSFNTHINAVCYHTSKRSLFTCNFCKMEMFDARKLERHVRNKHVKDVFKCNFCFVACFNLKDLDKHRQHYHAEKLAEEQDADDENGLKYAFHLCDMCPNRLIRRVRLGQHIWDHVYSNNEVKYVYECRRCKVTFHSKDLLVTHSGICSAPPPVSSPQVMALTGGGGSGEFNALLSADNDLEVLSEVYNGEGSMATPEPLITDFPEVAPIEEPPQIPESDEMLVDETEAPPPLIKAPPKIILPPKNPRTPQKTVKLISVKPDYMMFDQSKVPVVNNIDDDLSPEVDPLHTELEGGMEVALQCLECGINLTSELGSYCTTCEQKREAGSEGFPAASLSSIFAAEKKDTRTPAGRKGAVIPKVPAEKKGVPKRTPVPIAPKTQNKSSSGNFTCRLCSVLISRTCDKAAIKRHFISKHKDIFIAALQTGLDPTKVRPKSKTPVLTQGQDDEEKESCSPKDKGVKTAFLKKPSLLSAGKTPPKKKKKSKKAHHEKKWNESDTEDDSLPGHSPKDKKSKEKKRKSYSPSLPALEQGISTAGEVVTEQTGDVRSCYKCSFQSANKEQFMSHVVTHKTNPKDLQCPACGMCFVVRPSLEKHLLIFHGMKNVDEYLADHGFSPVEKESPDVEPEALSSNQCRVCYVKFDSEALLDKHFRTHGSAFLLSKQFRRS